MSQSPEESPDTSQPELDSFPEDLRELRDHFRAELDKEEAEQPFLADDLYHQTLKASMNDPDALRAYVNKLDELRNMGKKDLRL